MLSEVGFRMLEAGPQFPAGTRAYVNPWIVENRYRGHVRLMAADDPTREIEFPPTNMVLVAEKPLT